MSHDLHVNTIIRNTIYTIPSSAFMFFCDYAVTPASAATACDAKPPNHTY